LRAPFKKAKKPKKVIASKSLGKAPGEVVYMGDKENLETLLEVHEYTAEAYNTYETKQIKNILNTKGNNRVTWINVNGLNNATDITKIGEYFKIHPLILEDIVNTNQRPKIDEFENYIFVVLKMLYHNKQNELLTEHISFIIGTDYVLTFQETEEDIFQPIRQRFQNQADYLKDLQDHILQINDNIDLYREMVWGLMDMHMTTMSNKMNGIMKVLTIISTIFIPLTFIVGVYGMNFDNMPELHSKYGYFILWGIMVVLFLALLLFFRRKKWL